MTILEPFRATSDVGLGGAIRIAYRKFAHGRGRASRAEYWWFHLFTAIAGPSLIGLAVLAGFALDAVRPLAGLALIVALVAFNFPLVTVTVRRLHDTNKSAHYLWFWLLPFAGALVMLILMLLPSDAGLNRYGFRE